MIKKVFRRGLTALMVGVAALTPALATELRGIGLSSAADSAQLTLDLSDGTRQSLFTLDHPDRIVIDLPHTERMHGVHAPAPGGVACMPGLKGGCIPGLFGGIMPGLPGVVPRPRPPLMKRVPQN